MKKILFLSLALCFTASIQALTINVPTAGGLSGAINLTTYEKSICTELTLTGTIDARDFVTLRVSLQALNVLDISGVSISEYTGTAGTAGSTSTTYPANTIPPNAFLCNLSSYATYKISMISVLLPTTLTSIGAYAFSACDKMKSISIPSTVSSIGDYAFSGCSGLTSITIPANVTTIGASAFTGCLITSVTIPSSVKTIGASAFNYCTLLSLVSLPTSVTSIADFTFFGCSKLLSIDIPNSVTSIGKSAFQTSGLTSITIPPLVTSIQESTFAGCKGLTTVSIPSSVTSIANSFTSCSALTSIFTFSKNPVNLSGSGLVYYGVDKTTCVLHVPIGTKALYQAAVQWKDFLNIVEDLPNAVIIPTSLPFKVSVNNKQAIITGISIGESINVYTLKGISIYNQKAKAERVKIVLPTNGTYIVKVGAKSVKVVL